MDKIVKYILNRQTLDIKLNAIQKFTILQSTFPMRSNLGLVFSVAPNLKLSIAKPNRRDILQVASQWTQFINKCLCLIPVLQSLIITVCVFCRSHYFVGWVGWSFSTSILERDEPAAVLDWGLIGPDCRTKTSKFPHLKKENCHFNPPLLRDEPAAVLDWK